MLDDVQYVVRGPGRKYNYLAVNKKEQHTREGKKWAGAEYNEVSTYTINMNEIIVYIYI